MCWANRDHESLFLTLRFLPFHSIEPRPTLMLPSFWPREEISNQIALPVLARSATCIHALTACLPRVLLMVRLLARLAITDPQSGQQIHLWLCRCCLRNVRGRAQHPVQRILSNENLADVRHAEYVPVWHEVPQPPHQ